MICAQHADSREYVEGCGKHGKNSKNGKSKNGKSKNDRRSRRDLCECGPGYGPCEDDTPTPPDVPLTGEDPPADPLEDDSTGDDGGGGADDDEAPPSNDPIDTDDEGDDASGGADDDEEPPSNDPIDYAPTADDDEEPPSNEEFQIDRNRWPQFGGGGVIVDVDDEDGN